MARAAVAALLVSLPLAVSAAAKDPNTIVFASFGDWGWSTAGGQNILLSGSAVLTAACANYTLTNYKANPSVYAACLDGDKAQQGALILGGQQQVAQIATANAMAAACTAAGSCDFIITTGDNFYDLGVTGGTTDIQWTNAFQSVYTKALFGNTPFLNTLGNHDYSILNPTAAATQIAYSAVDSRWVLPDHQYAKTFKSASGNVAIQVVQVDSTPLHDRYLFSGTSGGAYATDASGADTTVDNPTVNAVLNSGVTAANGWTTANGWTSGNVFNASNFACGNCTAGATAAQCGYNLTTGALLTPYGGKKIPSGCKYASPEIAAFAHPAARNATWANVSSTLRAASGSVQYQAMFSHFPILSSQQRFTPYADTATSVFASLGAAAPQVYFNGHDHVMASMSNPAITSNGAPIGFITTGAGGISDYPLLLADGTFTPSSYPSTGYFTAGSAALSTMISAAYVAKPAPGTVTSKTKYNPDVNYTTFYSEFNGFTITTANATMMRVDFYLVNCTAVFSTGSCSSGAIGPLNSQYYAAKTLTSTAPTYVSAVVTVTGYSVATFKGPQAAAFAAAVAADANVAASAVTVTSVTAPSSGRHLLQSSVVVGFSIATTVSRAVAVSSAVANGMTAAQLVTAGLTSATAVTVATAPITGPSDTAPTAAVGLASSAVRAGASVAALVGATAVFASVL